MDRLGPLNYERLRWCSDDFGISPEEIGEHIHVSSGRWKAVLAGEEGLTFAQLRSMAEFFGRGVLFFLEPGAVNESQVRTPAFRGLTNDEPDLGPEVKALIERAERYRETFLAMREEIGEETNPPFMPPPLSGTRAYHSSCQDAYLAWSEQKRCTAIVRILSGKGREQRHSRYQNDGIPRRLAIPC